MAKIYGGKRFSWQDSKRFSREEINGSVEAINIAHGDGAKIRDFNKKMNKSIRILASNKGKPKKDKVKTAHKQANTKLINDIVNTNFLDEIINFDNSLSGFHPTQIISDGVEVIKSLNKVSTGQQTMQKSIELVNEIKTSRSVSFGRYGKYQSQSHDTLFKAMKRTEKIYEEGGKIFSYDLETLGGTNAAGQNQVDFITEIGYTLLDKKGVGKKPIKKEFTDIEEYKKAMKEYNKKVKESITGQSYSTVVGITEEEANEMRKLVKGFEGAEDSSLKNVYYKRLSMLSNEDMVLDMKDDAFEVAIKDTGTTTDVSLERALKGIEKMREIGKHQEKFAKSKGANFVDYRQGVIEDFQELVTTGKNKNLGIDLTKDGIVLGHNIHDFDNNAFQQVTGKSFELNQEVMLDTLQVTKTIENILGKGAAIPKGLKISNDYGLNTQDGIVYGLGLVEEGAETHNAGIDSYNRVKSLFTKNDKMKNTSFEHMMRQMYVAETKVKNTKSKHEFVGRKGVFLNHAGGTTAKGDNNALSFVYHPKLDIVKFANGDVVKGEKAGSTPVDEQLNQYLLKKNGVYEVDQFEMDINSDEFNNIIEGLQVGNDKFFNRLKGTNKVYVQKIKEYTSDDIAKELDIDKSARPIMYRISTNADANFSEMTKIGYVDGKGKFAEYFPKGANEKKDNVDGKKISTINVMEYLEVFKNERGEINTRQVDNAKEAVMKNSSLNTVDSVTRELRDGKDKILRARAFRQSNNGVKLATAVSELVSQNKLQSYTAKEAEAALNSLIGYTFNNKKQIASSAIPNLNYIENIYEAYEPILDVLEEAGLLNTKDAFTEKEFKNTGYSVVSKGKNADVHRKNKAILALLDKEIDNAVLSPRNAWQFSHAKRNQILSKDDFAVVDIVKNDVFTKKYTNLTKGTSEDFFRINLNSPNSMLRTFFENRYSSIPDANINGKEGYSALVDMVKYLQNDERFKDADIIPKSLNVNAIGRAAGNGDNIVQLSTQIQNNLKKFMSTKHLTYGMKYDGASVDKVSKEARKEIFDFLSYKDNADKIINNIKEGLASNEISGKKVNVSELAEQISSYMLNISEKDLLESVNGLDGEMRDALLNQYKYAAEDANNFALELANGIMDSGVEAIVNEDTIAINGGKGFRVIEPYKYTLRNGQIYTTIGKNEYNFKLGASVKDGIKGTPLINNNMDMKDLVKVKASPGIARESIPIGPRIRRAINDDHKDVSEVIERIVKGVNSSVAEKTSLIQGPSFVENIQSNLKFNYEEVYKIFPDLWEAGVFEEIMSKNTSDSNKELHKEIMEKAMDRLGDVIHDKKRRATIDDINSKEKLAFYRSYFLGFMDKLAEVDNGEKEITIGGQTFKYNGATKALNISLKSTAIESQDLATVNDNSYSPYASLENHMRDPVYQGGNALKYNKEHAKEKLEYARDRELGAYVDTEDMVTTSVRKKYDEHFSAVEKSGVALKTFNGNNEGVRSIMMSDVKNALSGGKENAFYRQADKAYPNISEKDKKDIAKKLAIKSENISTYEGQTFIDSRVADIYFGTVSEKVIKAHSMVDGNEPLSKKIMPIIEDNGSLYLQDGAYVDARTTIGIFGENEVIKKTRGDSWVTARYYNKDGSEASQEEVNAVLNNLHLWSTASVEDKALAFTELEKVFDFKIKAVDIADNGSVKIMKNATEKSTATSLKSKIGEFDKNLVNDLLKVGIDERLLGHSEALSVDTIELIEQQIKNNTKLFPKTKNDLINRMYDERHLLSAAVMDIDGFKKHGISLIGLDNTKKHNTVSAPLSHLQRQISEYSESIGENFIKALYGVNDNNNYDEPVNIGSTKKVSLSSEAYKKFLDGLFDNDREKVEDIINASGRIDKDGNLTEELDKTVGHIAYQEVYQIKDDKSGTYSSWMEKEDIMHKKMKEVDSMIGVLNSGLEEGYTYKVISDIKDNISTLESERRMLVEKAEQLSLDKGLKFNERMNLNLSQTVHNEGTYALMRKSVEGSEFGESMYEKAVSAYVDSEGRIDKEYVGKSMLHEVLERVKADINYAHGETSLKTAYKHNKDKYAHLVNSYSGDTSKISVEQAERLYAIKTGEVAKKYNSMTSYDEDFIKGVTQDGWKLVDPTIGKDELHKLPAGASNEIITDIGGQAPIASQLEFNPYNKNMVIKTGLTGEDEYIFSPAMPERVFEESEIKAKYIGMLGRIQDQIKDFKEDPGTEERLRRTIEDFKENQQQAIFGKKGLLGKSLEQRMGMSFSGKASGFTVNEITNGVSSGLPVEFNNAIHKAQFMGESLASHIQNGIMVDATFMGEKAFENIGYFEPERMKNFFGSINNDEMIKTAFGSEGLEKILEGYNSVGNFKDLNLSEGQMREGMKNLLRTYGDSALTTRFPNIMAQSDKASMIYLNDALQHNQIQQISYTGMSAKTDYDGDNFFASLIQNKRGSGETYLSLLASGENDDLVNSINVSLFRNATSTNRYWAEKTKAHELKMEKVAKEGIELRAIAKNRFVNSDINTRFNIGAEWESHTSAIEAIESFTSQGEYNAAFLDKAMSQNPDEVIQELVANSYFNSDAEIEDFSRDFGKAFSANLYMNEVTAKTSKGSIGETNVDAFKTKMISVMSLDKEAYDYDYKRSTIMDTLYHAEEAVISSKSAVDTLLRADRASSWNENVKAIFQNRVSDKHRTKSEMMDWLNNNVRGDIDLSKSWNESIYFQERAKEVYGDIDESEIIKNLISPKDGDERYGQLVDQLFNDTIDTMFEIGAGKDTREAYQTLRHGMATKGTHNTATLKTILGGSVQEKVFTELDNFEVSGHSGNATKLANTMSAKLKTSSDVFRSFKNSQQPNATAKAVTGAIIEGAEEIFTSSLPKNGLGAAAVGVAAGILFSGFVGGRPRPADAQAMEANQAHAPMEGNLRLADPSAQQGGRGGYVVNINARTQGDKGRVAEALQSAISSGLGSSVNVTMNIGNEYSNISNREIETAVLSALG